MTQATTTSGWRVEPVPALRGYQIEWAEEGCLLVSRRNRLYRTAAPGAPIVKIADFPATGWKALATRFRLLQRLFRFFYYNVVKLPDGRFFVSFDKSIGLLDGNHFEAIDGLIRPVRIMRGGCTLADNGKLYFGEYLQNKDRGPVRIYSYTPGAPQVEVVHTFEAGAVRHIHGIYLDPYSRALWCVTGDNDGECRVMRTTDYFSTIEIIGTGDETWRTVSLAFTKTHIYYAMDAEFTHNQVFRIDRQTGARELLGEVDGPVYFCRSAGEDIFFVVTAELCPSQIGRASSLVHIVDDRKPETVVEFQKDRWDTRFFMVGTLPLPQGPMETDHFYIHGQGLVDADNQTFVVRRS